MKKRILVLLLLLLVVGCGTKNKAASTPEEFAQSVFELLAANDSDEFIKFVFPSKEELNDFASTMTPKDRMASPLDRVNETYAGMRQHVLDSFAVVRREAAYYNCNLESASFGHCDSDVEDGVGDINVTITESGKSYKFRIDGILLINGRWYNMDRVKNFQPL
jgi:hypothetical protein